MSEYKIESFLLRDANGRLTQFFQAYRRHRVARIFSAWVEVGPVHTSENWAEADITHDRKVRSKQPSGPRRFTFDD